VIHPDEYEKRLMQFLFDKVFIDSKQTLNELLTNSKYDPDEIPIENMKISHEQDKSKVLQNLVIRPKLTLHHEEVLIESTSL
jgi:pyruvate-formate lyase-activating enzyme